MTALTIFRLNGLRIDATDLADSAFASSVALTERPVRKAFPFRLFVAQREPRNPEWLSYVQQFTDADIELREAAQSAAVLLVPSADGDDYIFALTWGFGFQLLNPDHINPDLGLKTVLNLLAEGAATGSWNPERLRAVRAKRISGNTLISEMQLARVGAVDAFPFKPDGDQLRQVTGTPVDEATWGTTVTGSKSLHVRRTDPERIQELTQRVAATYKSTAYKGPYGFIDAITPVADEALLHRAVEMLYLRIASNDISGIACSPPDLIDWTVYQGFEFRVGRKQHTCVDPTVDELRRFLDHEGLDLIDSSEHIKVAAIDEYGNEPKRWLLRECLTGEVEIDGEYYQVDDGALYLINGDFLKELNKYIAGIGTIGFPVTKSTAHMKEAVYNRQLAKSLKGLLLDRRTVRRPGATAIELCDVATVNRVAIHAKRGMSSASLSHLFSQGVVSATLLLLDEEFRKRAGDAIATHATADGLSAKKFEWLYRMEDPGNTTVAFLILAERQTAPEATELPFFSKVNLRARCEDLRAMGFRSAISIV